MQRISIRFREASHAEALHAEVGGKIYNAARGWKQLIFDGEIDERLSYERELQKRFGSYDIYVRSQPLPEVGMHATYCIGSDRYPYEIVAVKGNTITVRRMGYKRTDSNGLSESQSYDYFSQPEAETETVKFSRKDGGWGRFSLGRANAYFDPSF